MEPEFTTLRPPVCTYHNRPLARQQVVTPTSVKAHRTRRSPLGDWRALPFTAQLLVVGMLFGLFWFLAARRANDLQRSEVRRRAETLVRLQRAQVIAADLGRALASMARAQRGFLLSGDDRFLRQYDDEQREYGLDVARLTEATDNELVRANLDRLGRTVRLWQDSAIVPNVARRRAGGLSAFERGTPGARDLLFGAALIDTATALQGALARALLEDVRVEEIDAEQQEFVDDLTSFLIWTAALAVFLLVLTLLMRLVARALGQVIGAANALVAGRYGDAQLPDPARAPNREIAQLARTFDQLATSIALRESELQRDIEKLQELERLKNDFVSTVSHELRTPLTSMRGALGLILGGKAGEMPPKGRDLLQIAMSNTERLIRLINDILDIEKMDAGQLKLRRERLQLRPILETTLAGLEAFARDHQVTLRLADPADARRATNAEIIGDADRLIQVFTNLVSNAVKFSPAGGTVELSLDVGDGLVTVRVRDHGPGIPPEFAGRIFGRFQQAGGADSHKSGGTGLGLSIAKTIVEKLEGKIGFELAEGGGSIFWVTIPTAVPIAPESDPRRAVLIVEADASMRDVLVAMLEGIALPIAVQSAEAAFEVLTRRTVVAVVLDAELPGMDGFAFARALRRDPKQRSLPLFLFSAREHEPETLRAAGIRATDAYVKTRDSEAVLFERLRQTLDGTQPVRAAR